MYHSRASRFLLLLTVAIAVAFGDVSLHVGSSGHHHDTEHHDGLTLIVNGPGHDHDQHDPERAGGGVESTGIF